MSLISRYASLVKFSHTIFAAPFALFGYVYALVSTATPFDGWLLLKIALCMVFARNAAMAFNRLVDRYIDAVNPRTAAREIPAGRIRARAALWFVIANTVGFVAVAAMINTLALALAPVALLVILGYSYTKRFTAWSHLVLGTALAIAPVGAYVAVTGSISVVSVLLAAVVLTWVSGFDVLYAMQDAEHDRSHGLHSVPARFSTCAAVWISVTLHILTVYAVVVLGMYGEFGAGVLYWIGAGLFIGTLVVQHVMFRPTKIETIARFFTSVNGVSSITFSVFAIADLLLR